MNDKIATATIQHWGAPFALFRIKADVAGELDRIIKIVPTKATSQVVHLDQIDVFRGDKKDSYFVKSNSDLTETWQVVDRWWTLPNGLTGIRK